MVSSGKKLETIDMSIIASVEEREKTRRGTGEGQGRIIFWKKNLESQMRNGALRAAENVQSFPASPQRALGGKVAIDVVERAYRLQDDDRHWLASIGEVLLPVTDRGLGISGYIVDFEGGKRPHLRELHLLGNTPPREAITASVERAPNPDVVMAAHLAGGVSTASQAFQGHEDVMCHFDEHSAPGGVVDVLGFLASDGVRTAIAFCVGLPGRQTVTHRESQFWKRVGVHVAAGLRLRERIKRSNCARDWLNDVTLPGSNTAVLSPNGAVAEAYGLAREGDVLRRLRQAVKAQEQARANVRHEQPERALELWKGLVLGNWSLIDHFDSDGRRYIVAVENPIEPPSPRLLSNREQQVSHLVALGHSNKLIGYTLGLSETTVASHLRGALEKLGVESRSALCRCWAALQKKDANCWELWRESPRLAAVSVADQQVQLASLSPSERLVALAAGAGLSNAEIAQQRGTSRSTVVNQLNNIYRKLKVQSRSELAAKL